MIKDTKKKKEERSKPGVRLDDWMDCYNQYTLTILMNFAEQQNLNK